MRIIIYQISEVSNQKRLAKKKESLLYKQFDPKEFNIDNYQITQISFKFWDIKKIFYESILHQVEKDFKSFYTFEARPENGIIVSDMVKIGRDLYYYNGGNGWLYLGKQPVQRY